MTKSQFVIALAPLALSSMLYSWVTGPEAKSSLVPNISKYAALSPMTISGKPPRYHDARRPSGSPIGGCLHQISHHQLLGCLRIISTVFEKAYIDSWS